MLKSFSVTLCAAVVLTGCASLSLPSPSAPTLTAATDTAKAQQIAEHGLQKLSDDELDNANAYAEVALSVDPKNRLARQLAMKVALKTGNWAKAQSHIEFLSSDELDSEALGLIGLAYMSQNDPARARPLIETAFSERPDDWHLAYALSQIALKSGDDLAAESYLDMARSGATVPELIFQQRGDIYLFRRDYQSARQAYETAFSLSNGQIGDSLNYRLAVARSGSVSQALDGMAASPKATVLRELGRLSMQEDDHRSAVTYLKRARSVYPTYDPETERLLEEALTLADVS
ncbi:MAG: tetratricopeptide repeat protein [Henriciella sp.]